MEFIFNLFQLIELSFRIFSLNIFIIYFIGGWKYFCSNEWRFMYLTIEEIESKLFVLQEQMLSRVTRVNLNTCAMKYSLSNLSFQVI